MIHAHHFTDCMADLHSMIGHHDRRWNPFAAKLIIDAISDGERFYLPSDFEILRDRKIDASLKQALSLPFPVVVALKTIPGEFGGDSPLHTMNIAISREKFMQMAPMEAVEKFTDAIDGQHYFILNAFKPDINQRWATFPAIGMCTFGDQHADGVSITALPLAENLNNEDLYYFVKASMNRLHNLFAMLNLANVRTRREDAPKLNAKRIKNGKVPLYSYHVLEVDGEVWESELPRSRNGESIGVRSHMRRGHIRRLDEQRKVWVRATMVHGKRPGFVDKEYHTKTGITLTHPAD